jgi:hypothetical protein
LEHRSISDSVFSCREEISDTTNLPAQFVVEKETIGSLNSKRSDELPLANRVSEFIQFVPDLCKMLTLDFYVISIDGATSATTALKLLEQTCMIVRQGGEAANYGYDLSFFSLLERNQRRLLSGGDACFHDGCAFTVAIN